MRKLIPNVFTLLNLAFGFIAIICFLSDEQQVLFFNQDTNNLEVRFFSVPIVIGTIFIGIAGIVDVLDGFVARKLQVTSLLGKELDSLSDVVSFGVAPGILLYKMLKISFATKGIDTPIIALLPVLIYPCAIAYRLAIFTIDDTQRKVFKGMPSPAAGLFIAGLPWVTYLPPLMIQWVYSPWTLYIVIIGISYLAVSKHPMMSLKMDKKGRPLQILAIYILVLIGILSFVGLYFISFVTINFFALSILFFSYIVLSLIIKPIDENNHSPIPKIEK